MTKKMHPDAKDPAVQENPQETRPGRLHFNDQNQRVEHVRAFSQWLPLILSNAPGLSWDRLPSRVMGYLIRSVGDHPDAIPITLAIGCAMHAIKNQTLLGYCRLVTQLLRALRTKSGMNELADLRSRQVWDRFVSERMLSTGEVKRLATYDVLASAHVRPYLDGLNLRDRIIWEQYAFPPLPRGFIDQFGQRRAVHAAAQQHRKEQSDVLVALFPLLVEVAQLRKQAAQRLIKEFRRHRDRAEASEIELPYHFQYTDRQFSFSEDAASIASVKLMEREVTLSFTLWDRISWVKADPHRYSENTRWLVKRQLLSYAPEHTLYFLQYEGEPKDLLWCGDLIAKRRFGKEGAEVGSKQKDFDVSRPGLLLPARSDGVWLRHASQHPVQPGKDAVLFEPESLYRATLYAVALATLALTNGSRLTELLQVSATRFETIVVDELKNQQPTGRKIGILVQNLLPKGYKTESDRQYFLVSEMAARHLAEIGQLLETTHGGSIPVVHPSNSSKEEDLSPEPYLFQWDASPDGQLGLLANSDVGNLLRFLFYGLTLTTRKGSPIRVAPHLLRHVMATHIRTVKKVPAEAIAFLLHHRVVLPDAARALTIVSRDCLLQSLAA